MIQIIFDKESEFRWIKNALESGVMNISNPHTLRAMGVPLKQEINYKASDNYENDIKEKTEALLKRLWILKEFFQMNIGNNVKNRKNLKE